MRQSTRRSPTLAYGLSEGAVEEAQDSSTRRAVVPLLVLVLVLAAATVWYVVLPALHDTPHVERACEVIVLRSGDTACVQHPGRGSHAVSHRASNAKTH